MIRVFVPIVGQDTNIGDAMHRRRLLNMFNGKDVERYIYIGKAHHDFIEASGVTEDDACFSSSWRWIIALLGGPLKDTVFLFNSGEMTFSARRLLIELMMFPLLFLLRSVGGKVLRIGVAAHHLPVRNRWLWQYILRRSTCVIWRTQESRDFFQCGEVAPDLAFGLSEERVELLQSHRDILAVSMRFDRPAPSEDWIESVKQFAEKNDLKICVVTQVRMDSFSGRGLAESLSGSFIDWKPGVSHLEQEALLAEVYKRTVIIISDRLHALVGAANQGAIPCCMTKQRSQKVEEHFRVVGYHNLAVVYEDPSEMSTFLKRQLGRAQEVRDVIIGAARKLKVLDKGISQAIRD